MQNQLFNLTSDPHELKDLSRSDDPVYAAEVAKWRALMAAQFLKEGREQYGFVTADGTLLQRTSSMGQSPNYPGAPPPFPTPVKAGDTVGSGKSAGGEDCSESPQCWVRNGAALQLISGHGRYCMATTSMVVGASVVVDVCDPTSAAQRFKLPGKAKQVAVETETGDLCVSFGNDGDDGGAVVQLSACPTNIAAAAFEFGASGRMCKDGACLTVKC